MYGEDPQIFQPLDKLEKKPVPVSFKGVNIRLKNQDNITVSNEEEKMVDGIDNENLVKEATENEKEDLFILDRRRTSNINRNMILNRIQSNLEVKSMNQNIENEKQSRVSTPTRKLIIHNPVETKKAAEELEKRLDRNVEEATEDAKEEAPEVVIEKKKPGRKRKIKITQQDDKDEVNNIDLTQAIIRTQKVADRLPSEKEKIIVKASSYYMNNRKIFIQKLTALFKPYQTEIRNNQESISCGSNDKNQVFDLLTHQKIVRDYLNIYTPYRGLLLYHGLGSGKTCTSIAIAEGMKTHKRVFVMTPASLKMNFFSEMKKCGDEMYKKNQFWEFVSIEGKPDYVAILSKALSLSTQFIHNQKGAWLVNINKDSNYDLLETNEKELLDEQLNEMIRSKYTDINYNGMNENKMKLISGDYTRNPFDNSVIVIDEAHNFVSRIVNKIKQPKSISYRLYDYIMSAKNAKVVLLTGTPIINYPNEIGILYNLLRGYITTWSIPLKWDRNEKLNAGTIQKMLDKEGMKTYDYLEYSDNQLHITRNPYGFVNTKKRGVLKGTRKQQKPLGNKTAKMKGGDTEIFEKYNGVKLDDNGNIADSDFLRLVLEVLKKNKMNIMEQQIKEIRNKSLPDDTDSFLKSFVDVDTGNAINLNLFQRRILGLTSYFRSAQEELLPSYVNTEEGDIYHIEKIEMTDHQFSLYEKIRKVESDKESKAKKMTRMKKPGDDDMFTISSTYRIFSRAACNFTFPPGIERPIPNLKEDQETSEDILDVVLNPTTEIKENTLENEGTGENLDENEVEKYSKRIENALEALNTDDDNNEKLYLSKKELPTYSPKFAKILENISNPDNAGLHLVYSHFRTMEGIGILRLILLANGFAEFKIKRTENIWELVEEEKDKGKPRFVLYTGTESAEEKEIIRNVYNSMWEYVPTSITNRLNDIAQDNVYGNIIKVFMITSSGAEGINLKNTRFVHIVEPYWHMVRVEQVVGRARRICSHEGLPEELRNVKIYLYVATLSEKQKKDEKHIELIIRDTSKIDKKTPITTDESLYELASVKQRINNQILTAIKESAVDCNLYGNTNKKSEEQLVCYGFGKVESNDFSSYPSFEKDKQDKGGLDAKTINWKGKKITENGVHFVLNPKTNEVYDYDSYQRAVELGTELLKIGMLKEINNKMVIARE